MSVNHDDIIWGCAFSPDGKSFATASRDGTAQIWDSSTGEELLRLIGHTSTVTAVYFSPDGKRLATTSRDGLTKIWDSENGELMLNLFGDGDGVNGVAISPDGRLLANAGGSFLRVYLLNLEDLIALAHTRVTRLLSDGECQQYLHVEQCP